MTKAERNKLTVKFRISSKDYRRLLYFDTFHKHSLQPMIVIVVWIASLIGLCLHYFNNLALSKIIIFCCWMVALSIPFLVVSIEIKAGLYRQSRSLQQSRTLRLDNKGLEYYDEHDQQVGFDEWSRIDSVYVTKNLMIIYRDLSKVSPIPIKYFKQDQLGIFEKIFKKRLGNHYHDRVKQKNMNKEALSC